MSSSVSVLAPNGRRQTVKCTPNTTVLQILEEVCRKQGFKAEDYDIKHHNKVLDTSISFRFSGLPNNAQLELATATKVRVDSDVILAINLESGDRIVGTFQPDETLHNVVSQLCPNELNPEINPVVVYMRNEIYGDSLRKTTLRSLGLRGGRAMIRLMHKTPEELKTQANVSAPLPVKAVEEKPYRRTLKTETFPQVPSSAPQPLPMPEPKSVQKKNEVDYLKLAREKRKLTHSPVKVSDAEAQSPRLKPKIETNQEAMDVDVPLLEPVNEPEEEFVFLGERQAMLFSLESARSLPAEDLPDDFFELTIDDAKKILHDIKRKRNDMDNSHLMTSAMRNLEESKKQLRHLQKYKQSVIRVQFPDRTILQGSFKPTETVKDIKDFVVNYLQDTSVQFCLYTTPPKSILSDQSSLVEIGCVPGALLHLGATSSDDIHLKNELKDKFTTNSKASLAASKLRQAGTRKLVESQDDKMEEDVSMGCASDVNAAGPSSQPTSYERKVIKLTENVPKWFKPSK